MDDPAFKLANLLALELHKFEDEVSEIVDRAQKEEKMEFGLKKLEDVWTKAAFQFTKHKDTDVCTVKMAEEDFEVRWLGIDRVNSTGVVPLLHACSM